MRCLVSDVRGTCRLTTSASPSRRSNLLVRTGAARVDDPHPEGLGQARDLTPDPAQPDDPERLPAKALAEHEGRRERPLLLPAHEAVALGNAPQQCQHERDRELGGRLGQHVGSVRDDHAAPRRLLQVDAVVADAEVRDDAKSRPGSIEELGADDVGRNCHEPGRARDCVRKLERRLEPGEHRFGHASREEDLGPHVPRTVIARWSG